MTVELRHEGCPLQGILGPGEYAAHVSSGQSAGHVLIVSRDAQRSERFVRALGQVHDVAEPISQNDQATLVKVQGTHHGVVGALLREGAQVRWPVLFQSTVERYSVVHANGDPRGIVQAMEGLGEVRVDQETPFPQGPGDVNVPMGELASELTRRQLEAVLLAVRNGYYANPRQVTLEALARERGVSPSTFSEHVRKGEAALMRSVAGIMDSYELMDEVQLRGPGRPPAPNRVGAY